MTERWRPNGWKNPYNFSTGEPIPEYEIQSRCYENGADAMLKALAKEGRIEGDTLVGIDEQDKGDK